MTYPAMYEFDCFQAHIIRELCWIKVFVIHGLVRIEKGLRPIDLFEKWHCRNDDGDQSLVPMARSALHSYQLLLGEIVKDQLETL